jgi:hypothetical protein
MFKTPTAAKDIWVGQELLNKPLLPARCGDWAAVVLLGLSSCNNMRARQQQQQQLCQAQDPVGP